MRAPCRKRHRHLNRLFLESLERTANLLELEWFNENHPKAAAEVGEALVEVFKKGAIREVGGHVITKPLTWKKEK